MGWWKSFPILLHEDQNIYLILLLGPARQYARGDSRYTQRESWYTHRDSWYTRGIHIASNAIQHLKLIFSCLFGWERLLAVVLVMLVACPL